MFIGFLGLLLNFIFSLLVAVGCAFVGVFGFAQIFTILRFALPYSRQLIINEGIRFSKRIYLLFAFSVIFWSTLLSAILLATHYFIDYGGAALFGYGYAIYHVWKNCGFTPANMVEFVTSYGRYIKESPSQQSDTKTISKEKTGLASKIMLVALCLSLVASFAYNFYQFDQVKTAQNTAAQATEALNKSQTDLQNMTILYNDYSKKYDDQIAITRAAQAESSNLETKLNWYYNNIALINDYYGNSPYHKLGCTHLNNSLYIFTIKEAESNNCYPCPYCN